MDKVKKRRFINVYELLLKLRPSFCIVLFLKQIYQMDAAAFISKSKYRKRWLSIVLKNRVAHEKLVSILQTYVSRIVLFAHQPLIRQWAPAGLKNLWQQHPFLGFRLLTPKSFLPLPYINYGGNWVRVATNGVGWKTRATEYTTRRLRDGWEGAFWLIISQAVRH